MAVKKQYADVGQYEKKLERVMVRFNADDYNYNFDRHSCYVEMTRNGQLYRWEHSVEKAKEKGFDLKYGSDAFAQVVLTLEDLARMSERGIYDLHVWLEGMKFLPPVVEIPSFFQYLGYQSIPGDRADVKERYRSLAKKLHPDNGGNQKDFEKLTEAYKQAYEYFD